MHRQYTTLPYKAQIPQTNPCVQPQILNNNNQYNASIQSPRTKLRFLKQSSDSSSKVQIPQTKLRFLKQRVLFRDILAK